MPANHGILERPAQPGLLKQCPKCRRLFALTLTNEVADITHGTIQEYRCKYCSENVKFADRHPHGVQ